MAKYNEQIERMDERIFLGGAVATREQNDSIFQVWKIKVT